MKQILILIVACISLNIFHTVNSLKQFNFCRKTNEICVGQYDSQNIYAEKCEFEKCPIIFKYFYFLYKIVFMFLVFLNLV